METTDAPGFRRLCILLRNGFRVVGEPSLDAVMLKRHKGLLRQETAFVYDNGTVVLAAAPLSEKRIRSFDPDDDLFVALRQRPDQRI